MMRTILLLSLFVFLGCGGGQAESKSVAPATAPTPAKAPPPLEPMALLSPRSFAVGQVDFVRFRQSALWPRLLGLVERVESSSNLSQEGRQWIRGFLTVARSSEEVVFGAVEGPSGGDPRLVVVVDGMPPAEVSSFVQSMKGPSMKEEPIAAGNNPSTKVAGAVVEDRWVLSTDEELAQLNDRRAKGETPFASSKVLADAAAGARFGQVALSLAIDTTSQFVKDRFLSKLLIDAEPSAAREINSAAVWADVTDNLEATLELQTATPETAARLATQAQARLTSLRSELLLIPFGIRDLVDATQVMSNGKTATIHFEASEALASSLLGRLEGFLSVTLEESL